ncbi:MAG: penicillin-binding protein 2 [Candidatus Thioglobus sp.]|jgi:penicillin-binding protein 2|uniref:penicillin-binding protein 2 n=1 Tax=Candidatus Thioglobus sp. TaxID=2026721 RepID=UPI0001BD34D0|nr:penicillin-binding protein 2 [Candidatus Thioglobus sp.]EEZ80649.1 MAG: penicillin-binding protein 2 [uncultured Candidatus Thioglobus sp.]MBT3186817.1 penicillin-binding protein 2 [Candidatus Thioglobus sp.]MBT3431398.1 penicillin-binding protein 2 [Candidatus Thioglobus sp.]MBT3965093.1 penicillin-binding protein 2 [Candidatus Thioglobus sp.]MBT4316070.1 penicillin-binding protein 2 [Candidatus Thioglobus sp.]
MERISNTVLENKIFSSRLVLAFVFIFILTSILILRVYNLQIVNHEYYTEEALGNQMRSIPITPARGKIFDRNGQILATNQLSYRLTLTPEKVKNTAKTLLSLKKIGLINDKDIEQFNKNRKRYKKFHNIPLKHKLSEIQMAEFLVGNQFIGVDVEPYFHRVYPNGTSSVHVIGYVSRMNKEDKLFYDKKNYLGTSFVGKTGIEKQYETLLHGSNGVKQIERNVSGRVIDTKTIEGAVAGKDLYLSIDLDLQKKAESLLLGKRGSIVAVNVKNGEVLALVSTPVYNPNWFVNGISHANYQNLQTSKDIPQLNRSIRGLYPPGSTVKPMVALAGLEEGVITNQSKTFCPGYYKLPNVKRKFNDWKRTGHGHVDVKDSIAQSCDVFFYDLANKMGIEMMHDNLNYFNFGRKTGIDIPGEKGGILPSKAWKKINKDEPWYRGETLIVGIGQGFMTSSPLQLAVATAALANKGGLFKPKLLTNIQTPNQAIEEIPGDPPVQIPIKNIKNWEDVVEGMRQTIYAPKGTARRLNKDLTYTLAGKTGTAQVFGLDAEEQYIAEKLDERLRDHALFTGFAPIDNPEIAIAIIVENAGSGSSKAAPLARQVLDVYFKKKVAN